MLKFVSFLVCGFLAICVQGVLHGGSRTYDYATGNEFPFQVSIWVDDYFKCGGSIISKNVVLTAGHCVHFPEQVPQIYIRAGSLKQSRGGVVIPVDSWIIHENYIQYVSHPIDDIAMLHLATPLTFSRSIQPIALPSSDVPSGMIAIFAGWGRTAYLEGTSPIHLKWNQMITLSNEGCEYEIGSYDPSFICMAHSKYHGVCFGDSGGPAICQNTLVGIASTVDPQGCGSTKPDRFVRVYHYLDWINSYLDVVS